MAVVMAVGMVVRMHGSGSEVMVRVMMMVMMLLVEIVRMMVVVVVKV